MKTTYRVTMPDGSKYDIPVRVIALHRATNYREEFGFDVCSSLDQDTLPLFDANPNQIKDWAENNMNWDDVAEYATRVQKPVTRVDLQEGWVNGHKELL